VYLTEKQLAALFNLQPKTLQNWRWSGKGPPFVKLPSGAIRYEEAGSQEFMKRRTYLSTTEAQAAGKTD
jgi:hypothetical protein